MSVTISINTDVNTRKLKDVKWYQAIYDGRSLKDHYVAYHSDLGIAFARGSLKTQLEVRLVRDLKVHSTKRRYEISSHIEGVQKTLYINKLVLESMVGPPPSCDYKAFDADHKFGDKSDDSPHALQWLAKIENQRKSDGNGGKKRETAYRNESIFRDKVTALLLTLIDRCEPATRNNGSKTTSGSGKQLEKEIAGLGLEAHNITTPDSNSLLRHFRENRTTLQRSLEITPIQQIIFDYVADKFKRAVAARDL